MPIIKFPSRSTRTGPSGGRVRRSIAQREAGTTLFPKIKRGERLIWTRKLLRPFC